MPKGQKGPRVALPERAKFEPVVGQQFIAVREAAKLAGIHPVVLEMARELLKTVGTGGASFSLATADLQKNADAINGQFKTGLRKVAKAFKPDQKLKVKAVRDGNRLVFWYSA